MPWLSNCRHLPVTFLREWIYDLRHAVRRLRRAPAFSIVCVVTIALGIGANSSIFSLINAYLLRPLPYPEAQNLVNVWERVHESGRGAVAFPNYVDMRSQSSSFSSIAAWSDIEADLSGSEHAERLLGENVTSDYFTVLGVTPLKGRAFTEEEAQGQPVLVISYELWNSRFGGAADVVGRSVNVNGTLFTVVGVAPQGFEGLSGTAQVWAPMATHDLIYPQVARYDFLHSRDIHWVRVVGRLRTGVTVASASTELRGIGDRLAAAFPKENQSRSLSVALTQDDIVRHFRSGALALMGAVGFVLLVACANLANLFLTRLMKQQRDFATRAALGATRLQLARQALSETIVVALAGGAAGLALCSLTYNMLPALLPLAMPKFARVGFDWRVLTFSAAALIGTVLLVSMLPIWYVLRHGTHNDHSAWSGRSKRQSHLQSAIVVAEIGLAVLLTVGAALMVKSLMLLKNVDTGFRAENLLTLRFDIPNGKYEGTNRLSLGEQIAERARSLPGVESAAATAVDPFIFPGLNRGYTPQDRQEVKNPNNFYYDEITPGYFHTMGIPLLSGRDFTSRDDRNAPGTVIVSRSFANRTWQSLDVLGKHIKFGGKDNENNWLTVVGVVDDAQIDDLRSDRHDLAIVYASLRRSEAIIGLSLVVRTRTDPAAMIRPLQQMISQYDADMPVYSVAALGDRLAGERSSSRAFTTLMTIFGGLAVGLALMGVYGSLAFQVSQRTREIGIRMAMGAQRNRIIRTVMMQAGLMAAAGIIAGILAAWCLARFLVALLYRVSPVDLTVYSCVATLLAIAGLAAGFLPAQRAASVEPVQALRME